MKRSDKQLKKVASLKAEHDIISFSEVGFSICALHIMNIVVIYSSSSTIMRGFVTRLKDVFQQS